MYDPLTTHSLRSPRETPKRIQKEHRKKLVGARYTYIGTRRSQRFWSHTPTCPYLVHPWRVLIAFKFPANARIGIGLCVMTAGKNANGGQEGNSRKQGSRDL